MLNNKTILITGGMSSSGHKCVEIILNPFKLKRLIVFSRDELRQYEMAERFPVKDHDTMHFLIGDVRDRERLRRALDSDDIITQSPRNN
ncbi:MAG: UDP-N-acetylglucosamine 4,6-dehydratase (inverting) [Syntrophus sp. SKADARSKE-3]|nr:UDP-N-acetylglucosamine 4,6-dehydratase (inverting) [Syntrophus sp. SKADARSKE-3]